MKRKLLLTALAILTLGVIAYAADYADCEHECTAEPTGPYYLPKDGGVIRAKTVAVCDGWLGGGSCFGGPYVTHNLVEVTTENCSYEGDLYGWRWEAFQEAGGNMRNIAAVVITNSNGNILAFKSQYVLPDTGDLDEGWGWEYVTASLTRCLVGNFDHGQGYGE